jgi:hypothetical protein
MATFARFERRDASRSTPPWIVIFLGLLGRRLGWMARTEGRLGRTVRLRQRLACWHWFIR